VQRPAVFADRPLGRDRLAEIEAEVVAGRAAASVAARRLLAAFLGPAAAGQTDA
jgi:hypothetical protein